MGEIVPVRVRQITMTVPTGIFGTRVRLTKAGKDDLRKGYLNPDDFETEADLQKWFDRLDSEMELTDIRDCDLYRINLGPTGKFWLWLAEEHFERVI